MQKDNIINNIWEDRSWLPTKLFNKNKTKNKFSIISYHVFAESKSSLNHYSTTKSWEVRSRVLLKEIK
jgi:mRNA deadenylase 3'-5' endonuclease subunit Ccr4